VRMEVEMPFGRRGHPVAKGAAVVGAAVVAKKGMDRRQDRREDRHDDREDRREDRPRLFNR